ncbi:MAG: CoA pyrophosphatase [Sneathiella sp.]|nr:CoA pyrophosphatase [Sneathiella sp.]
MNFLTNDRVGLKSFFEDVLDPFPDIHPTEITKGGKGDHDLNPASFPGNVTSFKPAAVLVPIVLRNEEPSVILTRRASHLKKHAGQISFPGGRAEDEDGSVIQTALRESEEEIGLDPSLVEAVGTLSTYVTVTHYSVVPVVGFVEPDFNLTPEEGEVAEIFEVPLQFLLDRTNHQKHSGFHNGIERFWYAMPYNDYYIWGATAGMIKDLSERVHRT